MSIDDQLPSPHHGKSGLITSIILFLAAGLDIIARLIPAIRESGATTQPGFESHSSEWLWSFLRDMILLGALVSVIQWMRTRRNLKLATARVSALEKENADIAKKVSDATGELKTMHEALEKQAADGKAEIAKRSCKFEVDIDECFMHSRLQREGTTNREMANAMKAEIEAFEKAIRDSAEVKLVTSMEYIKQAKEIRSVEQWSYHLLYATEQSVLDYYSHAHNDWLQNERVETREKRSRIMIYSEELFDGIDGVNKIFQNLVGTCNRSSVLRVMPEDVCKKDYPELLRDCGVFEGKFSKLKGFFTYAPFPNTHVFAQCPGRYYIVHNQNYLREITRKFQKAWDDGAMRERSDDLIAAIANASPFAPPPFVEDHPAQSGKAVKSALPRKT